jgi:hypothetical protein
MYFIEQAEARIQWQAPCHNNYRTTDNGADSLLDWALCQASELTLNVGYNVNEKTVDYRCKYTQHLLRMNDTRTIHKSVYEYTLTGRRNLGRPRTRRRQHHQ